MEIQQIASKRPQNDNLHTLDFSSYSSNIVKWAPEGSRERPEAAREASDGPDKHQNQCQCSQNHQKTKFENPAAFPPIFYMLFQWMKCDISQSPSLYIYIYIIPDVGCNGRGWDQGYRSQRCRLKGHKGIGTRVLGPGLGRRAPKGLQLPLLSD